MIDQDGQRSATSFGEPIHLSSHRFRRWRAPFADGNGERPGLGPRAEVALIAGLPAQVVQMRHREIDRQGTAENGLQPGQRQQPFVGHVDHPASGHDRSQVTVQTLTRLGSRPLVQTQTIVDKAPTLAFGLSGP
jgi:hypothetical protein